MDAMVTARVPVEVRNQVHGLLREQGHTPTQLINAAYDYVLKNKTFPFETCSSGGGEKGCVSPEMLGLLQTEWESMSVPLAGAPLGKAFDQLRDECYGDRYARIS